ncbi:putative hemin receptor [hydrocarbon metagenome]|uniref:Putative hemin receptor n=1 Tax=hydrocarbon metagenome TaxID=938273 RepID=A0A0W8FYV6_9ZZZZ
MIDWDISGWDFKIGFLYKLPNFMKIGATVKFPTKYTIKENYFVEATSEFGDGTIVEIDPIRNIVEYDITSPYEFTGAFAYELADLTLSAEATFIDYTQMKFGDGLDQGLVSSNNRDIKDAFKEVINYNFGFEYRLPEPFISIRGGFIMQPSAFKNDPSEFNRKYITAGLGIMPNKVLSLDLAYAYGWWNNIGDNYGFDDSRTYQDITSTNVILTARYLF